MPLAIQLAGDRAFQRYFDFFTATIRNANTRRAYWRAVRQFFNWCEANGLVELSHIKAMHVSAYVEHMQLAPASV